ncbi:MAG: M23 family metallopeptidase [Bacilli bacterium]|nr:M23 family metallopeptidase [Bacilli bacterium]
MKDKKLKGWVLPSLYAFFFVGVFLVTLGVSNVLMEKSSDPKNKEKEEINYVSDSIIDEEKPVVQEVETMLKPYINVEAKISKYYYDYKATEENQEKSLTYHDNTYMQNSGIDYTAENIFDVVSVLDGTVVNVKEDDLLGKCVEIKHDNNYTSVYQSLSEVNVKKGDNVIRGQLIGKSGENKLDKDLGNHLHFELYIKGKVVNPLDYIDKEVKKEDAE